MHFIRKCHTVICLFICFYIALSCHSHDSSPVYWPTQGSCFREISWEIPVNKESNILIEDQGIWQLPDPTETDIQKNHRICHQCPAIQKIPDCLGQIDQVVIRESGILDREYYRFEKGNVLLVGYEYGKPEKQLTVYDPPLLLIPAFQKQPSSETVSEAEPVIYRTGNCFSRADEKTRIHIHESRSGLVRIDSTILEAILCDITISTDRSVNLGEKKMIVPDVVMMQNHVLIARGYGPVLEWGVRSRLINTAPPCLLSDKSREPGPPEYFIEATLHQRIAD